MEFGFGRAIAIDQDTIAVSAGHKNRGGSVYVFIRSGSTWVQQAQLFDSQTDSRFGRSVALQGNTLVVTAPEADIPDDPPPQLHKGAAYVYTRAGSTWSRQAMLVPPEPPYAGKALGNSVAIDGNTIVVGQRNAAHVFKRDSTTDVWSYQAKLVAHTKQRSPPDFFKAIFGPVVAISGGTIAVGGGIDEAKDANCVTLFRHDSKTHRWSYQSELRIKPKPYRSTFNFGQAIALEGETLVVGDTRSGTLAEGKVVIFERDAATGEWQQQTDLKPPRFRDRKPTELFNRHGFGSTIAIKGGYVAIAASTPPNFLSSNREGNAYLFRQDLRSGQWRLQATLRPDSQTRNYTPYMGLSNGFVVVGDTAASNSQGVRFAGAVYVFELESPPH